MQRYGGNFLQRYQDKDLSALFTFSILIWLIFHSVDLTMWKFLQDLDHSKRQVWFYQKDVRMNFVEIKSNILRVISACKISLTCLLMVSAWSMKQQSMNCYAKIFLAMNSAMIDQKPVNSIS